jgi:hypothetical protein
VGASSKLPAFPAQENFPSCEDFESEFLDGVEGRGSDI